MEDIIINLAVRKTIPLHVFCDRFQECRSLIGQFQQQQDLNFCPTHIISYNNSISGVSNEC